MSEEAKNQSSLNPESPPLKSESISEPVAKEEQKFSKPVQVRTKYVCAISESELNKVELAYFKRPLPPMHSLILSDK